MTVEVIQPRTKLIVTERQQLKLEKLKIKHEREEHLLSIAEKLILNPGVLYALLVIGLEWLATHPDTSTGFSLFGFRIGHEGNPYLDAEVAKLITAGLTAGLAANALGGGQGIAEIIKAFK